MSSTTDWNYLEMDAAQRNANDWDYTLEEDAQRKNGLTPSTKDHSATNRIHETDMFKDRGSRQSIDFLADEMTAKWSYEVNHAHSSQTDNDPFADTVPSTTANDSQPTTSTSTHALRDQHQNTSNHTNNTYDSNDSMLFPKGNTQWSNTLSTTAQQSSTSPNLRGLFTDDLVLNKNSSITDSQGIDMAEDRNIILEEVQSQVLSQHTPMHKDDEIARLRAHIEKIEAEKQELVDANSKLKLRNSELRKALNKAQQYRRKSSVAVANLMNIGDKLSELQREKENRVNEEKVREDEDLHNLQIQEQIQQAIAMFQEEFGAELDEELNNIESFQYQSLPEQSVSENGTDHKQYEQEHDHHHHEDGMFGFTTTEHDAQRDDTDTANDNDNEHSMDTPNEPDTDKPFQYGLGVNFAMKFADANSNRNEPVSPLKSNENLQNLQPNQSGYGQFLDDDDEEEEADALPGSYDTPGGPVHTYVTPGGPEPNVIAPEIAENESIELEDAEEMTGNKVSAGNVAITVSAKANDEQLRYMESRLNDLSEKMGGLMQRIQELTDRNQHLEMSKYELITSTSNAMNEYRETVRNLSQQNKILLARLNSR